MHFRGFPFPALPFDCQHQSSPVRARCASRNANHSFLDGRPTVPGPHPRTDPAVHGKPALGCGRRGERSHGGLENPTGGEERGLQPLCSALPTTVRQDWSCATRSTQGVLSLPLAPSQRAPAPHKHQTNCKSRESTRNSNSTASQTGSRANSQLQQLHLGDTEPNPHGVSSGLSQL